MTDSKIEEIRGTIKRFQDHYSAAANDYNASVIRSILADIANVAAPRPRPLDEVLFDGIARSGSHWLDGPISVEFKYKDNNTVSTHISSITNKLQKYLADEGYSIVYTDKPALSPVVDTGESPKVQLAKQINTLAKLLDTEGYKYGQLGEAIEVLRSGSSQEIRSFWGKAEDLNVKNLASYMSQIQAAELKPLTLDAVMSVLRDQFILSTDITQAIDRLNELVAITSEGEK